MPDPAVQATDKLLQDMEKRMSQVYNTAEREMNRKLKDYMKAYNAENKQKKIDLKAGKITQAQYDDWVAGKAKKSKWLTEMINTLSEDAAKTDMKAMSVVRGFLPEAYAVNYNYGAYEAESGAMVKTSLTLYDAHTVERIVAEKPNLLPVNEDIPKDKRWHKQKINNAITQGILQGESIPDISKRLMAVADMDRKAAVRNARTATTGAQNAGRVDSYKDAEKMGIELEQEWLATLDERTRHTHRLMDGVRVKVGHKFPNKCRFPGDPEGPPEEIYNCRCTLVAAVKGIDQSMAPRFSRLPEGVTYEDWKKEKESSRKVAWQYGDAVSGTPKEYQKSVVSMLNNAPQSIRDVWNKTQERMYEPEFDLRTGAHFDPNDEKTHYVGKPKAYEKNTYQEENACFFHEYGHNIDYILGDSDRYLTEDFEGGTFGKTIYEECGKRIKEFWMQENGYKDNFDIMKMVQEGQGGMGIGSYTRYMLRSVMPSDEYRSLRSTLLDANEETLRDVWSKYLEGNKYVESDIRAFMKGQKDIGRAFCDYVKKNYNIYERTDISDMFNQYTLENYGISYPFGVGHDNSYWRRPFNGNEYGNVAVEGFAEMFSATATQNQSLSAIKEFLPESYAMFERMIGEALVK